MEDKIREIFNKWMVGRDKWDAVRGALCFDAGYNKAVELMACCGNCYHYNNDESDNCCYGSGDDGDCCDKWEMKG